ncbi:hypothetical protein SteCoe_36855 [Stentor coeruleus]|uniref:Uncharacterized protein n=1 Tax=Stentor coeruleus TaxID=5963 RepID=A0A1R2AP98_9CILI|nr:hypothetical protein SteCoe_36855 [Stentor coeruleus]
MSGRRSNKRQFNLPSIATPVSKKENYLQSLIYKKFFVSSVLDDIRIPSIDSRNRPPIDSRNGINYFSTRLKGNSGANLRPKNYKDRVNCESVKPSRECKYYTKRIKKNNTNQNVEMLLLENYSKTPVEEFYNYVPSCGLKIENPYDLKKSTVDTGINTDLSLM